MIRLSRAARLSRCGVNVAPNEDEPELLIGGCFEDELGIGGTGGLFTTGGESFKEISGGTILGTGAVVGAGSDAAGGAEDFLVTLRPLTGGTETGA